MRFRRTCRRNRLKLEGLRPLELPKWSEIDILLRCYTETTAGFRAPWARKGGGTDCRLYGFKKRMLQSEAEGEQIEDWPLETRAYAKHKHGA